MRDFSNEQAERLLRSIALAKGFNVWLKVNLVAAGNGQTEIELPVTADMLQHHGFVHGGVVGALADTACSWAAATMAGDVVTSSYTVQFLAPAKATRLRAKAGVIKAGKRNASVQAQVFAENDDGDPKLVAVMLAAIAVLGGGA